MIDKKTRLCKSVESLQDDKKSGSSQKGSFPLSEENHLEVSPSVSPASTVSPTTADYFTALQSESPTHGIGQWPKERSSSIATTGTGTQQTMFPMRWKFKPRRFSDSQFSRQKMLRMFFKDKKVLSRLSD